MYYEDPGSHENVIALREELKNHPELNAKCEPLATFEECIAEIAAHVGVILDGAYTVDEIFNLCGILARKLKGENTLLIPVGFDPQKVEERHNEEIEAQILEAIENPAPQQTPADWAAALGVTKATGSPDITELTGSLKETGTQSQQTIPRFPT